LFEWPGARRAGLPRPSLAPVPGRDWPRPGSSITARFEHTSTLKLIVSTFGLPSLAVRDVHAQNLGQVRSMGQWHEALGNCLVVLGVSVVLQGQGDNSVMDASRAGWSKSHNSPA
jgi:hypothetical protein